MGHKADNSFFDTKRSWSKRKDEILSYYLKPYLAKVKNLKRPIAIIDGLAGPGRFGDGLRGSPLLICDSAKQAIARDVQVTVKCVEVDEVLHQQLANNLLEYPFAEAIHGSFLDYLSRVKQLARTHTVFLYIDPYVFEGFEWDRLDQVLCLVRESNASIELLINFNAPIFVRVALALAGRNVPDINPEYEDDEEPIVYGQSPNAEKLNRFVGGTWWRDALSETGDFPRQVELITSRFCEHMQKSWFEEVGFLPVFARQTHQVPKYYLVFGTRKSDGLALMNDAMARARCVTSLSLGLFDDKQIEEYVLEKAVSPIPRGGLIIEIIRHAFCRFEWKEIRGAIERLLKEGRLTSSTGKTRINDSVKVWRQDRLR